MAGYARELDAATLLLPDDWDETALPDGNCAPLAFDARKSVPDQGHVSVDMVPQAGADEH
jgi:hypothetical protein